MKKQLLFLIIISIHFFSFAQEERNITGIVLDAKTNEPLPNASILIKGTRKGAVTNFNGKFSYKIKTKTKIEDIILVVNFIGFKSKEIKLGTTSYFVIKLEEDVANLDEIIVTSSYGTKKLKQDIVGSIENIKTKDIVPEQVATSFDQLLEGQVAGVYIESNNQLGEEIKINIRGQGSLTPLNNSLVGTSTQPLIIVDGVILSEETGLDGNNFFDVGSGNLSENILNPLAKIGIQDIESFNILKDAAAVGLYGADAANGVIIITTKSGKNGKLQYNASVQTGISSPINQFKYLNGEQYNTVKNIFNFNNGDFNNVQAWNGVNTNWQELLNGVGTYTNYNFGISGGNKNWKYRANIGYQVNNEAQVNNDFKRLNGSLGLDYRKDKFYARIRFSPSIVTKNSPNTLYNFALDPTIPVFDANGDYTFFATYGNPLAVANQNKNEAETRSFVSSISLNYELNKDLKFSTLFGIDFSDKNEDRFFSGDNGSGIFNSGEFGRRMLRERKSNRWNWSSTVSYDKQFNKNHTFDALLGIELRKQKTEFEYAKGDGFVNFSIPQPITSASDQDYQADSDINTGRSIFSQVNYNFKKKYYLLANFRIDQSSAFGSDKNTALNGGLGAAWVINNESFFKSENINLLKLRSSFGSTGNSRIGSYRALGLYNIDVNQNGYNGYNFANPTTPPNPNLSWERNIKFNVGIDFSFLNKFSTTIEFFRDNIKDIITSRDVIPELGFNSVQINGAEMYNQGIEISLSAKWLTNKDFSWSTNFNYSKIRNKVTNLVGLGSEFSSAENARAQRIGFPTSAIWGFNFIGIDPATGRELFNVEGNTFDASYVAANLDNSDWVPIGDSQPDFFGGLRNSITYKNFTMNIMLSYAFGQDMLVDRNLFDNYNVLFNRNISVNVFTDAWQNIGDNAVNPTISKNNRIISNSTKYLFDASHIKLRAINLSYKLPLENTKSKIKSLSLFLNGTNLHYWFMSKSPEGKNGVAEFRSPYPEMRTISLGVNANF
ncbi:SusC/RagA family TonB-linked outer membrane protein [Polaribacter porphyrae]|uniref:SusC/RagA family TonB-linked outer membrane protein n=1 Tax=Polaribacter porphyrae TaxID=1137780 RepID=A0A2S7WQW3_9FLAO|nr:SusC/RagA family TonB-linked outer membrane protein [Polaribacter porphyrae]PQJ80010.1 SusC/RagA family TonB-linked outer membrane protein [Polaribacter porphyrae]